MSNSCDPTDCSLLGSSVHGILQARILEWVAVSFSGGSSPPRNWTQVSCIASRFFTDCYEGSPPDTMSYLNSEDPRSKELELSVCIHISSAFHQSRGINPIFHSEVQRMWILCGSGLGKPGEVEAWLACDEVPGMCLGMLVQMWPAPQGTLLKLALRTLPELP